MKCVLKHLETGEVLYSIYVFVFSFIGMLEFTAATTTTIELSCCVDCAAPVPAAVWEMMAVML